MPKGFQNTALEWRGNKSGHSSIGRWVNRHLAGRGEDIYVEPFGGMLGVLLQRPRASRWEAVGDVSGILIDWWTAVRDHPKKLKKRLEATPLHSQPHLREAFKIGSDPFSYSLVERAAAFAVICNVGFRPGVIGRANGFKHGTGPREWPDVELLNLRLREVEIWGNGANFTMEKLIAKNFSRVDDVSRLVYLDPPYLKAVVENYGTGWDEEDAAELQNLCLELEAKGWDIVVSSYPGEYPELEDQWVVYTKRVGVVNQNNWEGSGKVSSYRNETLIVSWED